MVSDIKKDTFRCSKGREMIVRYEYIGEVNIREAVVLFKLMDNFGMRTSKYKLSRG